MSLVASVGVTTHSGDPQDEGFWRRPTEADAAPPAAPSGDAAGPPSYAGPPPAAPPPPGWRPPMVVHPPAPRQLPPQDVQSLDADERSARTLTYGVAMVAGAVLVVVVCLLCSRILM